MVMVVNGGRLRQPQCDLQKSAFNKQGPSPVLYHTKWKLVSYMGRSSSRLQSQGFGFQDSQCLTTALGKASPRMFAGEVPSNNASQLGARAPASLHHFHKLLARQVEHLIWVTNKRPGKAQLTEVMSSLTATKHGKLNKRLCLTAASLHE